MKEIKAPMSQDTRNSIIKWSFFIALSLSHLIIWISSITTLGHSMSSVIMNYYNSSFMEFFKPMYYSLKSNPYADGLTATPLTLLIGYAASFFVKHDVFNYDISYMQHFAESMLPFMMIMFVSVVMFALVIYANKKGSNVFKVWFVFLILLSAPFLFMYEQGSMILITVTLVYLYICGYDSDVKSTRELAHVALAVATALSVYPVIFIILSLRKKHYMNALRTAVYSLALFILPVLFFGDLGLLGYYFSNIKDVVNTALSDGIAYRVDIISGLNLISLCTNNGLISSKALLLTLWAVILIILVVTACISRSKWRTVLALSLIAACGPFMAKQYCIAYLIIPLVMLLDSEEERIEADFIYTGLFVIMLAPVAIKDCVVNLSGNNGYELYIYSLICTTCVLFMILMLCIETVAAPLSGIELSKRKREYAKLQAEKKDE